MGDEPGCEQRFEAVAFLLALHGPGGVGVDEIDGFGCCWPLTVTRYRDATKPTKKPELSQRRFWQHCGDGGAFGAGSR